MNNDDLLDYHGQELDFEQAEKKRKLKRYLRTSLILGAIDTVGMYFFGITRDGADDSDYTLGFFIAPLIVYIIFPLGVLPIAALFGLVNYKNWEYLSRFRRLNSIINIVIRILLLLFFVTYFIDLAFPD